MRAAVVTGVSAVVLIAAGADIWTVARGNRTPISAATMQRAADRIAALQQPGDLVVFSPLLTAAELAPLGEPDGRPDRPKAVLRRRRRALVLDFESWPMYGLGRPAQQEAVGEGLVLRTYPPTGGEAGAVWDLSTDLTAETMWVERSERRTACPVSRSEGGYRCPGEAEWLYIAPRVLRIGGSDKSCVWAHPTTGGTIVLRVPAMAAPPPGHTLQLRIEAGIADDAVRSAPNGAAVTTEVVAPDDGRSLGKLRVPNRIGWREETLQIEAGRPLELRVTTARDGARHHCVRAVITEVEG